MCKKINKLNKSKSINTFFPLLSITVPVYAISIKFMISQQKRQHVPDKVEPISVNFLGVKRFVVWSLVTFNCFQSVIMAVF